MSSLLYSLIAMGLTAPTSSAVAVQDQMPVQVTLLPTHNDALLLAKADLESLPQESHAYVRYIWIPDADLERWQALSHAINAVGRTANIHRPAKLGQAQLLLVRVDLNNYRRNERDLDEWLALWEEFQFDPQFSLFITKGMLRLALENNVPIKGRGTVKAWKQERAKPVKRGFKAAPTKWFLSRDVEDFTTVTLDADLVELIRIPAPSLDQALYAELVALTGSQAPVVTDSYFIARLLATVEDKGIFREIFGGLYYEFAGIRKAKNGGTDEDQLLEDLGVGNIKAGITAKKIFDKLPSDQRAAIAKSKITRHPRAFHFFRTLSGSFGKASGLIAFTLDPKADDIDVDVHPLANLVDYVPFAKEVIWERLNGTHGYAAFDGKGALQREVPFNVALDETIGSRGPKRLQAAISCMSCHESQGPDGWMFVKNDVKELYSNGIIPLGDGRKIDRESRDKLRDLYTGEPERALRQGRNDYSLAVYRCTGDWKGSKLQTDVVKRSSGKLTEIWHTYYFGDITPAVALRESGVSCDPKEAPALLKHLLRVDPRAAVPVHDLGELVLAENYAIGLLKIGTSINRYDWSLAQPYFRDRVHRVLANEFKEKQ